jgi:hypothetical protein
VVLSLGPGAAAFLLRGVRTPGIYRMNVPVQNEVQDQHEAHRLVPNEGKDQETHQGNDRECQHSLDADGRERIAPTNTNICRAHNATPLLLLWWQLIAFLAKPMCSGSQNHPSRPDKFAKVGPMAPIT